MKSAGNAVIPTFPAHCPHGLQHLRYKRPMFAFVGESGYTLGFRRKIAHSGSQGETGAFRTGPLSLPSERSARSQTSPGRVSERRTLPLWDLGREVLPKNAESLRSSDALMRVAVPRRRGPAGLRDFFAFVEISICTSCDQGFPRVRDMGVSLPSACSACCRNTRRPFVKTANEQNSDFLMRLYNK